MQRGVERDSDGRDPFDAALIEDPRELREDPLHAVDERLHVLVGRVAAKRPLQVLVRRQELEQDLIDGSIFQRRDVAGRPLLVVLELGLQSLESIDARRELGRTLFDRSLGRRLDLLLDIIVLLLFAHSPILSELRAPEDMSRPSSRLAT